MSENYLKSRLKRKKVSVERGNRNQPPGQEPVRSPATPNTDGEEMRPSPESSPALGGSPAGRRETQVGLSRPVEGTVVGLSALEERVSSGSLLEQLGSSAPALELPLCHHCCIQKPFPFFFSRI